MLLNRVVSEGPAVLRRGHRRAGLLGVALILTGVGVAAASIPAPAPPPAPAAQPVAHSRPPIYALVYTLTPSDERIAAAQRKLITACMAAAGFAYRAAPIADAADAPDSPRPFGLESSERPPAASAQEQPVENPQGYSRALYGDPKRTVSARGKTLSVSAPQDGCLADAERRLLGDGRVRWMQLHILFFEAERRARDRLDTDAQFRVLNQRWQQCMREAGIAAEDPRSLLRSLPAGVDFAADPVTRADLRCKDRTGYLAPAYDRLTEMQRQVLAEDPALVADWTGLHARQDEAALRILA
ncbi:hypothetical protein [Amycolatopsis sp. NPDC021455]|uniref:hypothetical protein n=1 Tax=Amycolatopsis sp. NPDC021455 TaxID=3154901 RepID=UPI00340731B4